MKIFLREKSEQEWPCKWLIRNLHQRKITIKCVNLVRFLEDTSKMSKISYEGVERRGGL